MDTGPQPAQTGALRVIADRARARVSETSRSRASCASCVPTWRSTGWRRIRSPACSKRAVSASTRPAPSSPASRGTSSPSRPSTTCTASRRSGGWTRSWWRTSWSSTTSRRERPYDLWIGDEAWEVDYFLHENPELKRAAYCWLTDFVGWLPMPDGGEREAFADRRLQRRDDRADRPLPARARPRHLRRQPRRHRARDASAPTSPPIRDWTEAALRLRRLRHRLRPRRADRETTRAELGYRPTRRVCIVTVGGSGVGRALLRRVIDASPKPSSGCPSCA